MADKRKKEKKISTKVPEASATPLPLDEIQKKLPILQPNKNNTLVISPTQFESLVLQQAEKLLQNKQELESRQKHIETSKDLASLNNMIKEYLNSFILIGYTITDERVLVQQVGTHKDKDALMELMKNIFLQLQQNGGIIQTEDNDDENMENV